MLQYLTCWINENFKTDQWQNKKQTILQNNNTKGILPVVVGPCASQNSDSRNNPRMGTSEACPCRARNSWRSLYLPVPVPTRLSWKQNEAVIESCKAKPITTTQQYQKWLPSCLWLMKIGLGKGNYDISNVRGKLVGWEMNIFFLITVSNF